MPISVEELIRALDETSGAGEDAKHELISRGVKVVPELAAAVGSLSRFGKLGAIEAFEALEGSSRLLGAAGATGGRR